MTPLTDLRQGIGLGLLAVSVYFLAYFIVAVVYPPVVTDATPGNLRPWSESYWSLVNMTLGAGGFSAGVGYMLFRGRPPVRIEE